MQYPQLEIVKRCIKNEIEMCRFCNGLDDAGLIFEKVDSIFGNYPFFEIAMDIVGFPKESVHFTRDVWAVSVHDLTEFVQMPHEEIDALAKKMYDDLNELILQRPELFQK